MQFGRPQDRPILELTILSDMRLPQGRMCVSEGLRKQGRGKCRWRPTTAGETQNNLNYETTDHESMNRCTKCVQLRSQHPKYYYVKCHNSELLALLDPVFAGK